MHTSSSIRICGCEIDRFRISTSRKAPHSVTYGFFRPQFVSQYGKVANGDFIQNEDVTAEANVYYLKEINKLKQCWIRVQTKDETTLKNKNCLSRKIL